nr:hypothetical protein Iba_chr04eCG14350 [Ipomoea batatas]
MASNTDSIVHYNQAKTQTNREQRVSYSVAKRYGSRQCGAQSRVRRRHPTRGTHDPKIPFSLHAEVQENLGGLRHEPRKKPGKKCRFPRFRRRQLEAPAKSSCFSTLSTRNPPDSSKSGREAKRVFGLRCDFRINASKTEKESGRESARNGRILALCRFEVCVENAKKRLYANGTTIAREMVNVLMGFLEYPFFFFANTCVANVQTK